VTPKLTNIEIFTAPSCNKCSKARIRIEKLLKEMHAVEHFTVREVNIVEELDYAVSLSILTTPSIAINGELIYASLPAENVLRKLLGRYLNDT